MNKRNIIGRHERMPRDFHREYIPQKHHPDMDHALGVRNGYHAVRCDGQAHSSALIDNCMQCLNGVWGFIAVKDGES